MLGDQQILPLSPTLLLQMSPRLAFIQQHLQESNTQDKPQREQQISLCLHFFLITTIVVKQLSGIFLDTEYVQV